jgi:hypothetical protein
MMVQCRVSNDPKRADLREQLKRLIYQELGIDCYIDLVQGAARIFKAD